MTTKRIRQTVREREAVPGGSRTSLELRADELGDAAVPAILLLPDSVKAPAALLLHGYTSHKEMMSDSVGRALLQVGVASLAIDLPMHGERSDVGRPRRGSIQPLELMRNWKLAMAESAIALRYLAARPEIDREGLSMVGYSMGSFLGVTVAAQERAVRAVVLAAGGDLPADMPFAGMVRAVIDPVAAVRMLDGTPLLMVHGRRDRTVTPEQARRLFEAARGPKEIRWWDSGHYLPAAAIGEAAAWLSEQLGALGRRRTG